MGIEGRSGRGREDQGNFPADVFDSQEQYEKMLRVEVGRRAEVNEYLAKTEKANEELLRQAAKKAGKNPGEVEELIQERNSQRMKTIHDQKWRERMEQVEEGIKRRGLPPKEAEKIRARFAWIHDNPSKVLAMMEKMSMNPDAIIPKAPPPPKPKPKRPPKPPEYINRQ